MNQRVFDLAELAVPVIQAPMAGVATPALAAEVSRAGGLGSLGLGSSTAVQAGAMMAETAARLGSARYGVNLFCHRPAQRDAMLESDWIAYLAPGFAAHDGTAPSYLNETYQSFLRDDAMLAAVLAACPAVISFHFGLPDAARIAALRDTGALLLATATSRTEAAAIAKAGLDGIVAQGWQAGGHRGVFDTEGPDDRLSTVDLFAALSDQPLPVIPAGAIMDGAEAAVFLRAGAPAVQMGTAFLACPESQASGLHREGLSTRETVMTRAISGRPARALRNHLTDLGQAADAPGLPDYPLPYDLSKQLNALAGGTDYAAHWAGTGAAKARALPAAQLVARLAQEIAAHR